MISSRLSLLKSPYARAVYGEELFTYVTSVAKDPLPYPKRTFTVLRGLSTPPYIKCALKGFLIKKTFEFNETSTENETERADS